MVLFRHTFDKWILNLGQAFLSEIVGLKISLIHHIPR
nr:MAG TPA: hypothetical protein [Caudoviricetes sp.]